MTKEIGISIQDKLREIDPKPDSVVLAKRMISGAEQDPRAEECMHNFLEVAGQIQTPEAGEFLHLVEAGEVEVFVPKVKDVSEFDVMTATESVPDADGATHTEVLVNPLAWRNDTLIQKQTSEAVRTLMISSCRHTVEKAVIYINSKQK